MIGCCTTPHACRCPCCTAQLTLCMLLSPCRYLDFMTGHLKEVCNYELKPELRGELETAILHLEVRHTSLPCLSQPPRSPRAPFPASRASTHFTLAGEGSVLRLLAGVLAIHSQAQVHPEPGGNAAMPPIPYSLGLLTSATPIM